MLKASRAAVKKRLQADELCWAAAVAPPVMTTVPQRSTGENNRRSPAGLIVQTRSNDTRHQQIAATAFHVISLGISL
jgi:hypothetical protein